MYLWQTRCIFKFVQRCSNQIDSYEQSYSNVRSRRKFAQLSFQLNPEDCDSPSYKLVSPFPLLTLESANLVHLIQLESGDTTRTEGKMVGGYLSLRHAKEAALALTGIVVALLPWLAGLAAVTYKALVTGLVSLAVTAAVTHQRSYFM